MDERKDGHTLEMPEITFNRELTPEELEGYPEWLRPYLNLGIRGTMEELEAHKEAHGGAGLEDHPFCCLARAMGLFSNLFGRSDISDEAKRFLALPYVMLGIPAHYLQVLAMAGVKIQVHKIERTAPDGSGEVDHYD